LQQLILGVHPLIAIHDVESVWGLRHIEKTPLDLSKWDSSRDMVTRRRTAHPLDRRRRGLRPIVGPVQPERGMGPLQRAADSAMAKPKDDIVWRAPGDSRTNASRPAG
jgi:hypothetical protein